MITPELIARINELAKKKKTFGLTPSEVAEQTMLRRTYLENIKMQLKATLEQIEVIDEPTAPATDSNKSAINSTTRRLH